MDLIWLFLNTQAKKVNNLGCGCWNFETLWSILIGLYENFYLCHLLVIQPQNFKWPSNALTFPDITLNRTLSNTNKCNMEPISPDMLENFKYYNKWNLISGEGKPQWKSLQLHSSVLLCTYFHQNLQENILLV